jgi:hypothetical protein
MLRRRIKRYSRGVTEPSRITLYTENPGWQDTISATSFEAAQTDAQMSMYGANFYRNFIYQDRAWNFHGFDLECWSTRLSHRPWLGLSRFTLRLYH